MREYTRAEFNRYFVEHFFSRVRWALDPRMRKLDLTRSSVVEELVRSYGEIWTPPNTAPLSNIPRHIWMLWQQGWDKAPPMVRRCAESWQEKNPGWEVHLLDDRTLSEYTRGYDEMPKGKAWRSARANLARISLLLENGGVWADATLFCARPLDDWLQNAAHTGFFMFADPRPYRPNDNWFMVSAPQNYTMQAMRDMFFQYWGYFDKAHIYLWMHYLFIYLMRVDPRVRDDWQAVPKFNANGELIVKRNAFNTKAPDIVFEVIDRALVPAHKLNHKWRFEGSLEGTPVGRVTGLKYLHKD